MKIPYRSGTIEIAEKDLRDLQERHLGGMLREDDRWLIDALLSWFCIYLANAEVSAPERKEGL